MPIGIYHSFGKSFSEIEMGVDYYKTYDLHPCDLNGILRRETVVNGETGQDTSGLACILQREIVLCGVVNNYPMRRCAIPFDIVSFYRNERRRFRIYIRDYANSAVNLTGAVCKMTIRRGKDGPVTALKSTDVAGDGQIGSPDQGEAFFYIVPEDTSNLDVEDQYVFDVSVSLSGGEGPYTVAEGIINLLSSVV